MYDVIIIGAGPAGLSCGIYAARAGLKTLILEKMFAGGQVATIYDIDNYPGLDSIGGADLAMQMRNHAEKSGVEIKTAEVLTLDLKAQIKKLITSEGDFETYAVVLASGAKKRELEIKNEKKFMGMGVSYCATCDGAFYKGKTVAVVGGGNAALEDALFLANICEKIYLIHRREEFRADRVLVDNVMKNGKIEILTSKIAEALEGDEKLEEIVLKDVKTGEKRELKVDGVFIAVGQAPVTALYQDVIKTDEKGYIITGEDCKTNIEGVYAAGDVRTKPLRQIITAASDGAVAAQMAAEYINKNFK